MVVGSWDDRVYAITKSEPHGRAWMWRTDGDIRAAGTEYDPVYLAVSYDGGIYAFNPLHGELRWRKMTKGPIVAAPVASQGKIYVGSMDYSVYCIDLAGSTLRWRHEFGGPIEISPVIIGDTIYVVSEDRLVTALHRLQGREAGSGKEFMAGDKVWEVSVGRKDLDRPTGARVVCRGRDLVYVLNEKKEICAIDQDKGTMRWRVPFRGASFIAVNANYPESRNEIERKRSGTIFLGLRSGWFAALKEKSEY